MTAQRYVLPLGLTLTIAVIGWVDVISGPEYGMSLFYLAPVAIAAWHVGGRFGVGLAVAASALWFGSEVWTHDTIQQRSGMASRAS